MLNDSVAADLFYSEFQIFYSRCVKEDFPWKQAEFQREMIFRFSDMMTTHLQQYRTVTLSSRDHAKTYYSRPLILFAIQEGYTHFPVWCSYAHDKVEEEVGAIYNLTQTDMFKYHYGNVVTSHNKTEIHFTNGAWLLGKSVMQEIRGITHDGRKIDLLLLDDIETRSTVTSQADTAAIRRKILSDYIGSLDSNRRRVFLLGNYLDENQFIADLYRATPDANRDIIPLYDEKGKISWSERFVHKDIDLHKPGNAHKTSIESIKRDFEGQPGGERIFREDFLADPVNPHHRYHDMTKIAEHSEARKPIETIIKRGITIDVYNHRDDLKQYALGADLGHGVGLDYSVFALFKYSQHGAVLVAEGYTNDVPQEVFAAACVEFLQEYGVKPYINFDALQGGKFEFVVRQTFNDNLVYRQEKQDRFGKIVYDDKQFGFRHNLINNKTMLADKCKIALETGQMITFSERALTEIKKYTKTELAKNYSRATYENTDETIDTHWDFLVAHQMALLAIEQSIARNKKRTKPSLAESGFYSQSPPPIRP